jgi:purine-nucleoside phosphorylase
MSEEPTLNEDRFEVAQVAADWLRRIVPDPPDIAIVLGSGLGGLAELLIDPISIPYDAIPHLPTPTVSGHAGMLFAGTLSNRRVWMLQGRFHYYEGHDLDVVTRPIRILQRLGLKTLILSAATGGIRMDWQPGQIVCLSDHLNLLGENPLRGPNDDRVGPRFPDMTEVYSSELRVFARDEAKRLGIPIEEGVYACLPGPSYETPAEIHMLRTLGADVVGMSTVPEAIVARHGGVNVLAFALVTNAAAGVSGSPITHDEVIEAGRDAGPRLGRLIEAVVGRLPD